MLSEATTLEQLKHTDATLTREAFKSGNFIFTLAIYRAYDSKTDGEQ